MTAAKLQAKRDQNKALRLKVTEDDWREAYIRRHFGGWDKLKAEAECLAAERLMKVNQLRQSELCAWLRSSGERGGPKTMDERRE